MLQEFSESMVKLTVFVICAQTIIHFRPKETYEKYLRLLMNLLILLLLILPVKNLLQGGAGADLDEEYKLFQRKMEEYMEGAAWAEYDRWMEGQEADRKAVLEEPDDGFEEEIEDENGRAVEKVEIGAVRLGGEER